ncbi:MAG: ABC transporter permease subunit [Bacilli bacterium]|nr:ABC transporter permease subunit [Bacilli bacterium]
MAYITKTQKKVFFSVFSIIFIYFLWFLISLFYNNDYLFPSPHEVIIKILFYLKNTDIYIAIKNTFYHIFISFSISFLSGLFFGIIAGFSENFNFFIRPIIALIKIFPTIVFVLLFLVIIPNEYIIIAISFLIMFPIFFESIYAGIKNIDNEVISELKLDGAYFNDAIFRIYIPIIYPYILLGVYQSLNLSFKLAIMAEIIVGINNKYLCVGKMIHAEYMFANISNVLALSFIVVFIIFFINFLFFLINIFYKFKN